MLDARAQPAGQSNRSQLEFILTSWNKAALVSFKWALQVFQYHRAERGPKLHIANNDYVGRCWCQLSGYQVQTMYKCLNDVTYCLLMKLIKMQIWTRHDIMFAYWMFLHYDWCHGMCYAVALWRALWGCESSIHSDPLRKHWPAVGPNRSLTQPGWSLQAWSVPFTRRLLKLNAISWQRSTRTLDTWAQYIQHTALHSPAVSLSLSRSRTWPTQAQKRMTWRSASHAQRGLVTHISLSWRARTTGTWLAWLHVHPTSSGVPEARACRIMYMFCRFLIHTGVCQLCSPVSYSLCMLVTLSVFKPMYMLRHLYRCKNKFLWCFYTVPTELLATSASFLAEVSVRSPRKLFVFLI